MNIPPSRPGCRGRLPHLGLVVGCLLGLSALGAASLRAQSPVFSEDFESGALNPSVWDTRTSGNVALSVQQAQVAHGRYALQVHYAQGAARSYGFIVAPHLPESVRTHFFGRANVYISPGAPAGHDVLLNAGNAGYPISNFLELGASGGKSVMMSYQQNAADVPRGETIARGSPYPVGRWFCLEWEFNDHPDQIVVWIDGVQSGELAGFTFRPRAPRAADAAGSPPAPRPPGQAGTDLVKNFSDFAFGFRSWGAAATQDFDIYYDDIAIGSERIGPSR